MRGDRDATIVISRTTKNGRLYRSMRCDVILCEAAERQHLDYAMTLAEAKELAGPDGAVYERRLAKKL